MRVCVCRQDDDVDAVSLSLVLPPLAPKTCCFWSQSSQSVVEHESLVHRQFSCWVFVSGFSDEILYLAYHAYNWIMGRKVSREEDEIRVRSWQIPMKCLPGSCIRKSKFI